MKILAEEDITNNILNAINQSFITKKNQQVTFISGKTLKTIKVGETILKNSLTAISKNYYLSVGPGYDQIKDDRLYMTIFEPIDQQNNSVHMIIPFSANIASILIGALITGPKDITWQKNDIKANLDEIKKQAFNDIVIHQLFKFYNPEPTKVHAIPNEILNKIAFKGFEDDSFNMQIIFELPLSDIYPPLKTAILNQTKDTDYNKLSLAPIKLISYDEKSKKVQLITSLY